MVFQNELIKSLKLNGSNIAIECGEKEISYLSLMHNANKITHFLLSQKLKKETIIGIDLKDKSDIICSVIGIMNARCVFVLIDRSLPQYRIDYMFKDLNLQYVISSGEKIAPLSREKVKNVLSYDKVLATKQDLSAIVYPEANQQDSLYVYYTSGSTGTPKGILGKNCSLLQFVQWEIDTFEIDRNSRLSQFISPYFDAFLRDIFVPLLAGGTICIPPDKEDFFSSEDMISWIDKSRVSLIHCVPSLFRLINVKSLSAENFKYLKYILLSGEKLAPSELTGWYRVFEDKIQLVNLYGLTETTMIRTCYKISSEDTKLSRIPIGSPIRDTKLIIMDKNLKPCNALIPGELHIISDFFAHGYLNAPELTQEKFQKIRKGEQQETTAFRTGDKARKLPNGKIELIGREDRQIKLRGIRIELDEIEVILNQSDLLKSGVVTAYNDESGNESLVAFVIKKDASQNHSKLKESLQKYMENHLPSYMLPATMEVIDEFPLLPNGKINYKGLLDHLTEEKTIISPVNQIEEKVLSIWKDIIGDIPISTEDSFYQIGGNSLTVMNLIGKINKAFGVRISLSELFKNPTIKKQSEYICFLALGLLDQPSNNNRIAIPKTDIAEHYILTSAQRRLFFLHEYDNSSLALNLPVIVRIEGDLNKKRLNDTFNKLISRHESLRTYFEVINEQPRQKIASQTEFEIDYVMSNEQEAKVIVQEFIRPFDLSKAPLIRVGVIETAQYMHILMVDLHHIVSDGVSGEVLISDFMALYNNEKLPELKLQYKDYAEWQQSGEQQREIEKKKDFWLREFSGELQKLELPTDYPRPLLKSDEGSIESLELGLEETSLLNKIAEREEVTMYMMMLAIFNVLLSKLSGQEDIVVGTPTAGRMISELENVVGLFANTIPLRNYPKGDMTFKAFLSNLKFNTLSCFDNQDFPFEILIDILQVDRDSNRNPLFDIMFAYQNFIKTRTEIPGLKLKSYRLERMISKLDLSIFIYDEGDKIILDFEYSTRLFKTETIRRFIRYFKKVVSVITLDIYTKISLIELLPVDEKQQLVSEFNDTKVDYPQEETVISLFERQTKKNPNKVALRYKEETLSFGELKENSDRVALYLLREKGVKAGDLVGLMLEPEKYMISSILGILKAGGVYVPIDPDYPSKRIDFIIEDTKLKFLITRTKHCIAIHSKTPKIINFDQELDEINVQKAKKINTRVNANELAYVIYTSGSTGKPNGVLIKHKSVVNYVHWCNNYVDLGHEDKWVLTHSFAFDAAYTAIFCCLSSGAELHILPKKVYTSPADLLDYINNNQISHLKMVPSLYSAIIGHHNQKSITNLKSLILGGEKIRVKDVEKTFEISKNIQIINHYGPTETTIGSIAGIINRSEINDFKRHPTIGKPIYNTKCYILDDALKLMPIGVEGKLYIGGQGLGIGYLDNDRLTKQKFINNPFVPNELIYKTGDIAKWLDNGSIEFIGRIDNQVKIRGFRVELGEIETQLIAHDQIQETVVLAKNLENDKYLIAYYVSMVKLETSELKNYLSKRVPAHMIPAYYIHLHSIPLTPNGKLDRRNLPDPNRIETEHEYIAPSNEMEKKMVEIWSKILNIDAQKISVNGKFFKMGGHSLSAMALVNKVFQELSVEILLKDVFKYQDIISLSKLILSLQISEKKAIKKAEKRGYYPLSMAQKPIYFLYEFDPSSLIFNLTRLVKIEGTLDRNKFKRVLDQLILRHGSLRTSFEMFGEEPVQMISKKVDFEFAYFSTTEEGVESIFNEFVRPFDLNQAPLLRVGLIEIEPQYHLLMVDMHHIIADGLSIDLLVQDFMALYNDVELSPIEFHYKDFVIWQQSPTYQRKLIKQKDFWVNEFTYEIKPLEVTIDSQRLPNPDAKGGFIDFSLSIEETLKLRTIAEEQEATMAVLILAFYNILIEKLTGQEDVVVGVPLAGREQMEMENVVGMFARVLPIRTYPKGNLRFNEFLSTVKFKFSASLDNQSYPYEDLASELNIKRDALRNPWFDIMFMFEHFRASEFSLPGLKIKPYNGYSSSFAEPNLNLIANERKGQTLFQFAYSQALFGKDTMQKFISYFKHIVKTVINDVNIYLSEIEIVEGKERNKMLSEFNNTKKEINRKKTYSDLFKEQVEKTPLNIAVQHNDSTLSYQALYDKSISLSAYLTSQGIKAHEKVALYMPNGINMLISFLAIFRSGGAYVPIDIFYPKERIKEILYDSEVEMILTIQESAEEIEEIIAAMPSIKLLSIVDQIDLVAHCDKQAPDRHCTDDLAYVIYTSGTTGKPKGVLIHQLGMINHLNAKINDLEISDNDIIAQTASPCFDISVWQFLAGLLTGAKTLIIDREKTIDPEILIGELQRGKITVFESVPSLITSFLDGLPKNKDNSLEYLRWMIPTGEPLNVTLVRKWCVYYPNVRLLNAYGPTEASDDVTHYVVEPIKEDQLTIPIGKPIQNTHIYILDQNMSLCPIGVRGEICVAGLGIGKGYWKDPEKTKRAFVPNPFISELENTNYNTLFKTGDLGYYLKDGNIICMGRVDEQVKIRGNRIEIGEIENRLRLHTKVKETVVLMKGEDTDKHLVAYYSSEEKLEGSELRNFLTDYLPRYMVPSYYKQLEKMPLTPNGKLNRSALPDIEIKASDSYIAPSNEIEKVLVDIWSEILIVEKGVISVITNYFHIGGHSLNTIALTNKIKKEWNVKISLKEFFAKPTVKFLAEYIEAHLWLNKIKDDKRENKTEIVV